MSAAATASAPRPRRQPRWTPLIGAGLHARVALRRCLLENDHYWKRRTASLQRAQLRALLRAAARTEFGRARDFARLAALDDAQIVPAYRSVVPVRDYEAFREPLARMREEGQPDVLWPGLVRDFAQTSGTTAGDKYIPVSRQMLRSNYRAGLDIFATAERFGVALPRLLKGKAVFLGGSTRLTENQHGVRTGDLSGLVTPLIRWPLTEIYLPGADVALMDHWPTKIDAMARRCLDHDVRMINGMVSWSLVLMDRVLELARRQGRFTCLREVWPNLQLFVHGGVKYSPFDARIRQVWSGSPDGDDIPTRLELYPASEGFIAIQDLPADPGLRLLSDIGVFYEFVPLESVHQQDPPAVTCDEVEPGVRYVVVMTTCAGLWRYLIGDVVEFQTAPDRLDGGRGWGGPDAPRGGPCRLRIVGRHRLFINAFGENLIVEHIENAVVAAARKTGLMVGEFTAAPVYPGQGRSAGLELAAEFDAHPEPAARHAFAAAFDEALKAQNVDYTTKRTGGLGMAEPTITPLPPGAFHRWMESRGKLGGQHKCPRCANHRDIIEQVVAIAG